MQKQQQQAGGMDLSLDVHIQTELLSYVEGLGYFDREEGKYISAEDCIEYLKELIRFLRRESVETRECSLQLGKWKLVSEHLLPLLNVVSSLIASSSALETTEGMDEEQEEVEEQKQEEWSRWAEALLKLLVMVTLPLPPNNLSVQTMHLPYMQEAKAAFIAQQGTKALMTLLLRPLEDRTGTGSDERRIELALHLLKNLLLVEDAPVSEASAADHLSRMHDQLVQAFQKENVLEMLMMLMQSIDSEENEKWNFLLLEIVHLLLRKESPELLWKQFALSASVLAKKEESSQLSSEQESEESDIREIILDEARKLVLSNRLSAALLEEKRSRSSRSVLPPQRHSRFGGTFYFEKKTNTVTNNNEPNNNEKPNVVVQKMIYNKTAAEVMDSRVGALMKRLKEGDEERTPGRQRKRYRKDAALHSATSLETKLLLKTFVDEVLQNGCYNRLMTSVREQLDSGSPDVMRSDKLHYLWAIRFFVGYQRLALRYNKTQENAASSAFSAFLVKKEEEEEEDEEEEEKEKEKEDGEEDEGKQRRKQTFLLGPVSDTLDFETFVWTSNQVSTFLEDKNWDALATSVSALKELLVATTAMEEEPSSVTWSKTLQSKIIFAQDLFTDVFVKLAKTFNPKLQSLTFFNEVVEAIHVCLRLTENYASRYGGNVFVRRKAKATSGDRVGFAMDEINTFDEDDEYGEASHQSKKKMNRMQMEEGEEGGFTEERLDFERIVASLGSSKVIKNYCLLLRGWQTFNSKATNHHIVKLFHRLAVDYGDRFRALFYSLSVLALFSDILNNTESLSSTRERAAHKALFSFANFVAKSFFQLCSNDKELYLHLIFAKNRYDVELLSLEGAQALQQLQRDGSSSLASSSSTLSKGDDGFVVDDGKRMDSDDADYVEEKQKEREHKQQEEEDQVEEEEEEEEEEEAKEEEKQEKENKGETYKEEEDAASLMESLSSSEEEAEKANQKKRRLTKLRKSSGMRKTTEVEPSAPPTKKRRRETYEDEEENDSGSGSSDEEQQRKERKQMRKKQRTSSTTKKNQKQKGASLAQRRIDEEEERLNEAKKKQTKKKAKETKKKRLQKKAVEVYSDSGSDSEQEKEEEAEEKSASESENDDDASGQSDSQSQSENESESESEKAGSMLRHKLHKLLEEPEGPAAVSFLCQKIEACIRLRQQNASQSKKNKVFAIRAKPGSFVQDVDEYVILQNRWVSRIMKEMGFVACGEDPTTGNDIFGIPAQRMGAAKLRRLVERLRAIQQDLQDKGLVVLTKEKKDERRGQLRELRSRRRRSSATASSMMAMMME
ncbi:Topoisomerase 1-associated factor 1 [Balamuthia mandrillaris]